jgi:hypothetical protein
MDFRLTCLCGQGVTVTEAAAETDIGCSCGRAISVPSLKEMRLQAGLPAYDISPETIIEHLLPLGQLPGSKACVGCGAETDHSIQVLTECERSWSSHSGGFSWMTLLLSALFFPFRVWLWQEAEEREYGRDKVYSLPLPVCTGCKATLRGRKAILQGLHKIPEYARLLDKFPDASVVIQ